MKNKLFEDIDVGALSFGMTVAAVLLQAAAGLLKPAVNDRKIEKCVSKYMLEHQDVEDTDSDEES